MKREGDLWVIVLGAGQGTRVSSLMRAADGTPVPKQFCPVGDRGSMMAWALRRARRHAPSSRIVPIVAEEHRRWWAPILSCLPQQNVVVQPQNKGTAAGILLPLMRVLSKDRQARVLVMPSDHYIEHENVMRRAMALAAKSVEQDASRAVLLGIESRENDVDYGWIQPTGPAILAGLPTGVAAFVEKPSITRSRELRRQGALINSFIITARADRLIQMYTATLPSLLDEFLRWNQDGHAAEEGLSALYDRLTPADFSRDVLQAASASLSVLPVPECGWTDLGTPDRLRPFLPRRPVEFDSSRVLEKRL